MSEQDRKPVKATEGKATDDAPANKPSQEVLDLLQEARRREKVGSAPLQWGQVLETLFDRVPVATSYREIVPVLRGLADREPQSTLTATIDDEGGAFEIGATLDLQIQSARGYLSEDTGPKGVFAINLLLEAIVRCAKLSDEMGRSAPQFQGAKLSPERLYMLAQEIAVFSLVPSGDIEALLRRLSVKERVSILPGPDDTGISLADIRRRQTKGGWTEPLIEPFAQNVALVLPDDPWQPGLKDRSGAEREVAAFASMFTARDFNPPLAVGVFGDWGSGKSFFIRLLHEAVEQSAAGGGKDRETLEHVVQIHFNAWHYAETNLWASIVDRIFTELDGWSQQNNADSQSRKPSIVEQLATSRRLAFDALENLIAARRLKNEAKQALDDATQAYADKKEEGAQHKRHLVGAAFATLLSENGVKHELEKAAETLGLKGAAVDASAFRSATRTLSRELEGTHKDAVQLLNSLSVPYGLLLAALFVCLPLVFAVLAPWLLSTLFPALSDFTGAGASLVAGLSGVLAMGAATLRSVTRHVEKARATFRTFAAKFEAAIEREAESEAANRARAEEEVLRIKREVDRCREEFEAASRAAAEASVAFNAEDPRQRLVHFLRDRVRSGVYSKELGFIATIRKDFEKLSQLMTASTRGHPNAALEEEARKELEKEINKLLASSSDLLSNDEIKNLRALSEIPAKPTTTFERIILYVDDLDRCPPDQVVAVLQAIHLLLTFPLFVVVVAVDMRWVLRALDSHYGDLLNPGEDGATSMDYLEKIFQIPYRVRDFRSGQTGNLVSDQLQPFVQLDDAPGPAETRPHAEIGGAGQTETVRQGSSASVGAGPKVAMPQIRPLSLSPDEVQFLDRLDARHSWSPRRRLRFANSYLLVRASMEQHTQTDLQQLAVMLACSEEKNMVSAVTELCEVTSVSVPSSTEFDQLQDYVKRFTFESK